MCKYNDLALLPIRLDRETDKHAWAATTLLAHNARLTCNGAAYLELAKRRGLPLATLDKELRIVAKAEDVVLLGM
jgi:predicted nucleic acid-binding protein